MCVVNAASTESSCYAIHARLRIILHVLSSRTPESLVMTQNGTAQRVRQVERDTNTGEDQESVRQQRIRLLSFS